MEATDKALETAPAFDPPTMAGALACSWRPGQTILSARKRDVRVRQCCEEGVSLIY